MTIALIGMVLSLRCSGTADRYTLSDFRLAFCVQYLFWGVGLFGLLRARRRLRSARGLELDPFHQAVARKYRDRRDDRAED